MSQRPPHSLTVLRGGQPPLPSTLPPSAAATEAPSLSLEERATALLDHVIYGDWDAYTDAWQAMVGQPGIPQAATRLKHSWQWELERIAKRLHRTPETCVLLHLALLGLELVRWEQLVIESGWNPAGPPIQKPQVVPEGLVIEEQALAQLRGKRDAAVPRTAAEEDERDGNATD